MKKLIRIGGMALLLIAWMTAASTLLDLVQGSNASVTFAQKSLERLHQEEEQEPPTPEMIELGREVFEYTAGGVGCASCHGSFGVGDLGNAPRLRGRNEEEIRGALGSIEEMDFLSLTDEEIVALAAYLQYLGPIPDFKTYRSKGVFEPAELTLPVGTEVQLIVQNNDRSVCTFELAESGLEGKEIGRRTYTDFMWTTPDEPGTFTGACAEDPEQTVTIIVAVPEPEPEPEAEGDNP